MEVSGHKQMRYFTMRFKGHLMEMLWSVSTNSSQLCPHLPRKMSECSTGMACFRLLSTPLAVSVYAAMKASISGWKDTGKEWRRNVGTAAYIFIFLQVSRALRIWNAKFYSFWCRNGLLCGRKSDFPDSQIFYLRCLSMW
eukprot:IDg5048t1